jgi:hypothetical protein
MTPLEAEIAITALHATGEFTILRKLNLERGTRFTHGPGQGSKKITGITDEMVTGQAFDDDRVRSLADKATMVIARNAAFDRKFVEARYPTFTKLP